MSESLHTHSVWNIYGSEERITSHGYFKYTVILVELESACLSGQVRRPLYSFDSTQPLGCLGGSVVRAAV